VTVVDATPVPARPRPAGHIRVYTDPAGAAELMRRLVGIRLFDAVLREEEGHWYVDVRDGDGVLRQIVDLVSAATDDGTIGFATLYADDRTRTFSADSRRRVALARE
jgi:hypothetical protein